MIRKNAVWITIGVLVVIMVIGVVAFGSTKPQDDAGTGIPPQDPAFVAAGEALYQANCASCHGVDLRGTSTGPSHLSIVYEPNHHGDVAFVLAAKNGVQAHHWQFGNMEPVPGLSDEDLEAIVAYVRSIQREEGFEPYPP